MITTFTTVATCSNVIRGFFPPKPLRLFGQEEHRDSGTQPMLDQAAIRSNLERAQPGLLLGPLEPFLDVPPCEGRLQHLLMVRPAGRVADEVLDLFGGGVAPPDKLVITEVYPSIFRNRYPRERRNTEQQDAYEVACWLRDVDEHGFLDCYFNPPLTDEQRRVADLEGRILGIT